MMSKSWVCAVATLGLAACGGEAVQPEMSEWHARRDAPALEAQTPGTVYPMGPAPNLTVLKVIAVCSADFYAAYAPYDCEAVSNGGTTVFNHGGAWMEAVTEERGYRAYGSATMAGSAAPEIANQTIINSSNAIIGWYRWFNIASASSGQFVYNAASINTYQQFTAWATVQ